MLARATSVAMPQTNMLAPISRPSCSRLGKSTTSNPRNVAAVVHIPSTMLAAGADMPRIAAVGSPVSFKARRCVTYSRTTPSTPSPNNIADAPAAAADSVAPANPSAPSTIRNDNADGKRADRDQPQAAKDDQQQRQDQRERADAVDDALASDDGFGFEPDAVSAGKLRHRAVDGRHPCRCAAAVARSRVIASSRSNSACENAVSYGGFAGRAITSRRRPSAVT